MNFTVRRIRPGDEREWLRMRDALWPGMSVAEHHVEMKDYQDDSGRKAVFVVERDGGLYGFLEAATREVADGCETSPVGYIEGWYIEPPLRRAGAGGALVAAAESWAKDSGYREMASDCEVSNEVSFRAHTALGYGETERLIHFRKLLHGPDSG